MVIPSNRTLIIAALAAAVLFLFLFIGLASASSTPDAAALLQQSKEARSAAHKVVCGKLGGYVNDCFNGSKDACSKLDAGAQYHSSEFGNDYLKTCRADYSF